MYAKEEGLACEDTGGTQVNIVGDPDDFAIGPIQSGDVPLWDTFGTDADAAKTLSQPATCNHFGWTLQPASIMGQSLPQNNAAVVKSIPVVLTGQQAMIAALRGVEQATADRPDRAVYFAA